MKNMKKILTILPALALLASGVIAQSEQASKMIRFGMKATPSIVWYKSGEKIAEKNGSSAKFGGGLQLEIRLTDVAVIGTGLQVDMDGGKIKYDNTFSYTNLAGSSFVAYWYDKSNEEIAKFEDADNEVKLDTTGNTWGNKYEFCILNERKYHMTYITIPLTLKFRTKEIGALTYFGELGVKTMIKYSSKATDEIDKISPTTFPSSETKAKMKIKDMAAINEVATVGAGAEWNLSGSTSLLFALNYNFGFTNASKSESEYLRKMDGNYFTTGSNGTPLKQSLKTNSISLTVGVLF
jgi:hypothetical protein